MHYDLARGPIKFGGYRALIAKQIDPYLTPAEPHMTFDARNALCFGQGFFPPNLVTIAISKQFDPWMTFDPRWGRFENMPTNLVGPSPTPMPSFSLMPQSMAKRTAEHTSKHTDSYDFSSIDLLCMRLT